ncbi:thymidine kinase [Defluviimonas salinarum]|uniref:Thymidine kinase n=1 Tax=Defluviimonas salinarum TaxID=2992147 RepID=A0ABT3J4B0_9RHOB|nr:thymidine kinase [Defluviimonas salinarum]MCW3782505.1 thymidine kinase [Defluviimonas salinarum]
MSLLTFVHGTMSSGKTTALLQEAHNFRLHGLNAYLLTAAADTRSGLGVIRSRIGISAEARIFAPGEDLLAKIAAAHEKAPIAAVMVDEAQFLSRDQVWQLSDVADDLGIRVTCYGLRTDFLGRLFEGSAALMALADELKENTGVCASGEKANMVLRIGADGQVLIDGPQVLVGGEESYVAVSRRAWKMAVSATLAGRPALRAV